MASAAGPPRTKTMRTAVVADRVRSVTDETTAPTTARGEHTRPAAIRTAVPADADAVLAFWAVAAEDAHRPPDDIHVVRALLDRDPQALLVAVAGSELVGSLIAGWDGWRGHLYRLAVHPDHRRRGIGTDLLRAGERRLAALGARRFDAMVLADNADAHALWAAAGYAPQDEWSRWVKKPARGGA